MRQEPESEPAESFDLGPPPPPAPPPVPAQLHPPRTVPDLVLRHALLTRLLASTAPLVVVSAPAGSGKTTALVQWTEREPRPHAWLQLEAAHNDPLVLLISFVAALEQVAPIDPLVGHWARLPAPPLRERIVPSLRASLRQTPPFLFVLDDAQLLTSKAGWEIVSTLFGAFPLGAQLAVGTRTEPPLPLARLEAARRLVRIDSADLAFSVKETSELLELRGLAADEETVAALQTATEGWATGISLAALACEGACTRDWVAALHGDKRAIARYLTTEVLERQSRPVRSFLLETSILERLADGSCRAVTGRTDAGHLLARLARDNVFLTSLDGTGEGYRYHHLFAELLRGELKRRDGARLPELHSRAAAWCEEQGELEEAVRHWLAAGEVSTAADIVCHAYFLYSSQGRMETIRRWIDLFTDEQVLSSVPLTLTAGWVASMTGDVRTGRLWSSAALNERVDDSPMPFSSGTQRASQAALRAGVAPDGVAAMRRDAELAARLAADTEPVWRAGTGTILGVARWLSGESAGADMAFRHAIEDSFPFNVIAEIGALGYLSLLLADQGHWDEAETLAAQAKRRFQESELGLIGPAIVVPLSEARVLAHRGATPVEGQIESVEAALSRLYLPTWTTLAATVVLAEVALERGDLATAERWAASGMGILRTWPDAGILRGRLERLRRTLGERRLAGHLTPMEQRVLELLATHLTLPEIAQKLFISQNTLKTHVRDLYLKLDVHSRSAAVERAQELGLLKS